MEAPEEFTASNDHTLVIKGKRTKRQRPSSPFAAVATSSLSSGGGSGGGGGVYWSIPSPASSSGEISTSAEEDEDMANCLILLAQGVVGSKQAEEADAEDEGKIEKLCSRRRFSETATTTTGKAGFYVYECKTCNRTFPSFQALGGHRASHKKPKTTVVEEKRPSALAMTVPPSEDVDDDDEEEERQSQFTKLSPPLSLQMPTKPSHTNHKPKVHECSICGSEFSSGQALGGHMRRHRAAPNTRNAIDSSTVVMESNEEESDKPRNILPLDLNLPAPLEDDDHHQIHHHHRDTNKFQFAPNKQHLVFSAAALVDCHY